MQTEQFKKHKCGLIQKVSNFLYEERLNDALRPINILQPQYVPAVVKEFKELLVPSFSRQIGL